MANILIVQTLRYLKSLPVPYIVILCVWELEVCLLTGERRINQKKSVIFMKKLTENKNMISTGKIF